MWRSVLGSLLLAVLVAMMLTPAVLADFSPQRTFPSSWDRVQVFADQLPSLSDAQAAFAASHYAGTQKQTTGLIDHIRQYNPNFLMLQYRLGTRDSGQTVVFIHNNTWSSDWSAIDPHEDWFVHDSQGSRVYMQYGSVNEYVMDAAGLINGNATNGWKQFWAGATLADITASHGDGVFADSSHLPYNIPSEFYDSHLGNPPHTNYIDDLEAWYAYEYQQYTAANRYFIPNVGNLTTTVDTTQGYYTNVHGAMVEGFATKLSNYDWKQQANRTLQLIRNGKIYIAQNGVNGVGDIAGRNWLLANFLLLRHDRSFLNIEGAGSEIKWLPEYDLQVGAPLDRAAPASIDALRDASGIYERRYEQGLVLVNPTGSALTLTLSATGPHTLATPYGGGDIRSDGTWSSPGGFTHRWLGSSVTLAAWSGIVLTSDWLPGDANGDGIVDQADYTAWYNSYGLSSATWEQGDFNGDGQVDQADYTVWYNNYGTTAGSIPEPGSLLLLLVGGSLGIMRRR